MTIEDLAQHVSELEAATPRERVLLTRNGKPFAIVSDASYLDEEDIGYITSPDFWKMIAERRKQRGGIPIEQIMARLGMTEADALRESEASESAGAA